MFIATRRCALCCCCWLRRVRVLLQNVATADQEIRAVLEAQVQAGTRATFVFMKGYAKSDRTRFQSGGEVSLAGRRSSSAIKNATQSDQHGHSELQGTRSDGFGPDTAMALPLALGTYPGLAIGFVHFGFSPHSRRVRIVHDHRPPPRHDQITVRFTTAPWERLHSTRSVHSAARMLGRGSAVLLIILTFSSQLLAAGVDDVATNHCRFNRSPAAAAANPQRTTHNPQSDRFLLQAKLAERALNRRRKSIGARDSPSLFRSARIAPDAEEVTRS